MSRWQHAMCFDCWHKRYPTWIPTRVTAEKPETCCYCGAKTSDGIYVREHPGTAPCGGQHAEA